VILSAVADWIGAALARRAERQALRDRQRERADAAARQRRQVQADLLLRRAADEDARARWIENRNADIVDARNGGRQTRSYHLALHGTPWVRMMRGRLHEWSRQRAAEVQRHLMGLR